MLYYLESSSLLTKQSALFETETPGKFGPHLSPRSAVWHPHLLMGGKKMSSMTVRHRFLSTLYDTGRDHSVSDKKGVACWEACSNWVSQLDPSPPETVKVTSGEFVALSSESVNRHILHCALRVFIPISIGGIE